MEQLAATRARQLQASKLRFSSFHPFADALSMQQCLDRPKRKAGKSNDEHGAMDAYIHARPPVLASITGKPKLRHSARSRETQKTKGKAKAFAHTHTHTHASASSPPLLRLSLAPEESLLVVCIWICCCTTAAVHVDVRLLLLLLLFLQCVLPPFGNLGSNFRRHPRRHSHGLSIRS